MSRFAWGLALIRREMGQGDRCVTSRLQGLWKQQGCDPGEQRVALAPVVRVQPVDADHDGRLVRGQVPGFRAKADPGAVMAAELAELDDRRAVDDIGLIARGVDRTCPECIAGPD